MSNPANKFHNSLDCCVAICYIIGTTNQEHSATGHHVSGADVEIRSPITMRKVLSVLALANPYPLLYPGYRLR